MKVAEKILSILAECRIENNTLFLPPEQLDRKTYEAVNKCLVDIGGKWNRKAKGHIFEYDPTEAFEARYTQSAQHTRILTRRVNLRPLKA